MANELLWAVYPPYTDSVHDVLEVLDFGLVWHDYCDSGRLPTRVPLIRADVMQLIDAHNFGGGIRPDTQK